jgi:hypothetical protein
MIISGDDDDDGCSRLNAEEDEEHDEARNGNPEADFGDHRCDDGEFVLERSGLYFGRDEREETAPFCAGPDCQDDHAPLALHDLTVWGRPPSRGIGRLSVEQETKL